MRPLSAAKSHLTGDFLTYYSKFADQIIAPAAKQKAVTTHAAVVRAAVAELHADSAKVMVFVNQNTTSRDNTDPVQAASSVMVTLTKMNGNWLIRRSTRCSHAARPEEFAQRVCGGPPAATMVVCYVVAEGVWLTINNLQRRAASMIEALRAEHVRNNPRPP